jgi:hypothetical protein
MARTALALQVIALIFIEWNSGMGPQGMVVKPVVD